MDADLIALRITNVLDLFTELGDAATADFLQQAMAFCRTTIETSNRCHAPEIFENSLADSISSPFEAGSL